MARKYTHIKYRTRSIKKSCMHCERPATVTADQHFQHGRIGQKFTMEVWYCTEHAEELIEERTDNGKDN